MLCGNTGCGCAFESVGLVISQGADGQIRLEPAGPGIVSTSASVTSPFLGQTIYETTTGRLKVYDGTNWVIYGGNMPMVSLLSTSTESVANNTTESFVLGTEIYDTDGFHSGTNGFVTIPAGYGGVYMATGGCHWDPNATGTRMARLAVGNNTGVSPAEPTQITQGGNQIISTVANGFGIAKPFRLRAAATLTGQKFQTSGGSLNTVQEWLTLTMVRHEPALV